MKSINLFFVDEMQDKSALKCFSGDLRELVRKLARPFIRKANVHIR